MFYNLAFFLFAGITALSALMVVILRNLLHAAVALFICLTGVAALYILLGADYLGAAQLLIYAGGILVLLIFGIFLTANIYEAQPEFKERKTFWIKGILTSVVIFGVTSMVISKSQWPQKEPGFANTTSGLGDLFLTKYLLPFELISVLLLFTMVGALILVRKELDER